MYNLLVGFLKRVRWFKRNYLFINDTAQLVNSHQVVLPNVFLGKITYATDSLVTSNNCDFIIEPRFAKAYALAQKTNPWDGFTLQWRVYIVCWFANHVKNLKGDFVECGVNTGAYSRAVIDYINFQELGKIFYLFDTFEGFPEEQMTEAERKAGIDVYGGDHYKDVYAQVIETFENLPVKIIRGRVPETLSQCQSQSIAYLSIDMNAALPEIAAADYFWPKLVSGGVMVLDDYGFPPHINQKLAFDQFAVQKGVTILSLPTGQAVIFKP